MPKGRLSYFAGLDIGQLSDYTALAIMERVYKHEEHLDVDTQIEHRLVHLDRFELGTPYPEVVEKLGDFFARHSPAGHGLPWMPRVWGSPSFRTSRKLAYP